VHLEQILAECLAGLDYGLYPTSSAALPHGKFFLDYIIQRTGILVEDHQRSIKFLHTIFKYYLAAQKIARRSKYGLDGVDVAWVEIKEHLHDAHWREVVLLLLGILGNEDEQYSKELMQMILHAGRDDSFEPVLHRHLYLCASALAYGVPVPYDLRSEIIDKLLNIIQERPVWEKVDVFEAFRPMGSDPQVIDLLYTVSRNYQVDPWARMMAAHTLGILGQINYAFPVSLDIAKDSNIDPNIRMAAALDLLYFGRVNEAESIFFALKDYPFSSKAMRLDVKLILYVRNMMKHQAIPISDSFVANFLDEASAPHIPLSTQQAVYSLIKSLMKKAGSAGVELLMELVTAPHSSSNVRQAVIQILVDLGHDDISFIQILGDFVQDTSDDLNVRLAAANALIDMEMAEEFIGLFEDRMPKPEEGDWDLVVAKAYLVMNRVEDAIQMYLGVIDDSSAHAWIRLTAMIAVGSLGHLEKASDVLLDLAQNPKMDEMIRIRAVQVLVQLGFDESTILQSLHKLVQDTNETVNLRCATAQTLGQLGEIDKTAHVLLELVQDTQVDDRVRGEVYQSIKRLMG